MSDIATVCHREVYADCGGATIWSVRLLDGFIIDCGSGVAGEQRALSLARAIKRNRAEPEA